MSFRSKAQMRHMFATDPKLAEEFASKTKSINRLPERVNGRFNKYKPTKPKTE